MKKFLIIILIFVVVCFAGVVYLLNYNYLTTTGLYFSDITVNKDQIIIKCESLDSLFVIKDSNIYERGDTIYLEIYKGFMTKKIEKASNIEYNPKTDKIDKIFLVGRKNKLTEIWNDEKGIIKKVVT